MSWSHCFRSRGAKQDRLWWLFGQYPAARLPRSSPPSARVRLEEVRLEEQCPTQVRPTKQRPAQVRLEEQRPAEICPA